MLNDKKGYEFKILSDSAAISDSFPNKTHENSSISLYQIISGTKEGVTLGLEGAWGAGKSTVINLLREKMRGEGGNKTLFFMFDAWAHNGDPLRRIFLESLIEAVDPKKENELLQKISGEVSGRKKTVTVTTTHGASKLGKAVSISAIFVPFGAAILSCINFGSIVWGAFWVGLIFSLAPAWVLLYWSYFSERNRNGEIDWDVFSAESTQNYTQDITEDGERTSIEFESFFNEIINIAVRGMQYEKLIIVVDNLDRIDPSDAKIIWSTLQTFFQHRSIKKASLDKDVFGRVWFLIPYDRRGFSSIWNRGGSDEKSDGSFLDKFFQVKIEVPPPLMSEWIDYFNACVQEGLSGWPEEEKEEISAACIEFRGGLATSPTPRRIRSLVNQIGINGMRWGGTMSARSICLYSLMRLDISEERLRELLLAGAVPNISHNENKHLISMELAGMLFGVEKELGVQLLLGPEITSTLYAGDGEPIKAAVTAHGKAFWIVWNAVKEPVFPTAGHTIEHLVAFTNAVSLGFYDSRGVVKDDVKRLYGVWQAVIGEWNLGEIECTQSLKGLAALMNDSDDIKEWIISVAGTKLDSVVSSDDKSSEMIAELRCLLDLAISFGGKFDKNIYKNLDANKWIEWRDLLDSADVEFASVLPQKGALSTLATMAFSQINPVDVASLKAILDAVDLAPSLNECEQVADQLGAWLINPQRQINNMAYELAALILTGSNSKAKAKIESSIKQQAFWDIARGEDDKVAFNRAYIAAFVFSGEIQGSALVDEKTKSFWSSGGASEKLDKIYTDFMIHNCLSSLWNLAKDSKNKTAIDIIKGMKTRELYSLEQGAELIDEYEWAEDDDIKDIVENLCAFGGVSAAQKTIRNSPISYDKCIFLIKTYGNEDAREFVREVILGLSGEIWIKAFDGSSWLLECIEYVDHKFKDALEEFTLTKGLDGEASEYFWEHYTGFVEKSVDSLLMMRKLAEAYFKCEKDFLSDMAFEVFSKNSISQINAIDKIDVMERVNEWIDGGCWLRLKWIIGSGFELMTNPLESLVTRVQERLGQDGDEQMVSLMNELVRVFNIKIEASSGQ